MRKQNNNKIYISHFYNAAGTKTKELNCIACKFNELNAVVDSVDTFDTIGVCVRCETYVEISK